MPTSEWKAATSSGIEVIGTRRAITAPMPPPIAMPSTTSDPGADAGRRMRGERGDDRDRHADHAEQIAAPARLRAGQPAQRQDEQDAGDEIEQRGEIGGHRLRAPYFFLLVHRQHALGDQEAAEDVDRGKDQRDEAERARPDRAAVVADERRRRPRAARRPRSPRRSRWSPTSAACAAPASPTRPRSSRRRPPARRSRAGTRRDRRRRRSPHGRRRRPRPR